MAKSKVLKKNQGFKIEGILDYKNKQIEVEDVGNYPFAKIFEQFEGKTIKVVIDIPDEEIFEVPEV